MKDVDNVISAYRLHGWTYLMGVSPLGVLAELTGRVVVREEKEVLCTCMHQTSTELTAL